MTYFLQEGEVQPFAARGPDLGVQSFGDAVGAGYRLSQLETNANFRVDRELAKERAALVEQALPFFSDDELSAYAASQGADGRISRRDAETLALGNDGGTFLNLVREKAEADPAAWQGFELSDKAREDRVNKRLQDEHKAARDVISMTPGAAGTIAPFIGGVGGVTADVRNAAFLFFGGGQGSFWRGLVTAAGANVAAEAAFLPSQFEMAQRLNIPDPDVAETLAMAAAGGAAFEAAFRGLGAGGRAIAHALRRDSIPTNVPGLDPQWQKIVGDAIEDAMENGTDPIEAMDRVLGVAPAPKPEPLPGRPPLVPDEPPASNDGQMGQPVAPARESAGGAPADVAPDQETPPVRQAPELPAEVRALVEKAQADEADAIIREFPIMRFKHPLVEWLKSPNVAGGIQYRRANPLTGEMELTHAAQELANAGITPKTHPFLFRENGHGDLDNIVASEHPGLAEVIAVDPNTGYFDRDALINALIREVSTGEKTSMSGAIAARRDAASRMADDVSSPLDDFRAGRSPEDGGGFFVDKTTLEMFPDEWQNVERRFDEWLGRSGHRPLDRERDEILHELLNRGGDAEYLVEQTLSREIDADEAAILRPKEERHVDESLPFGDGESQTAGAAAPVRDPFGQAGPAAGNPPEPGAGAGQPQGPAVERTTAGDQLVIPGAERVDPAAGLRQRQQAEIAARSQQSMIRRGDQSRVESDAGTLFGAGAQPDMFDAPGTMKARPGQDQALADVRDQIEKAKAAGASEPPAGFTDADGSWHGMTTLDGTPIRTAQEGLDYVDDMELFAGIVGACGDRTP